MIKQFFIIGSGFSKDYNNNFPVLSNLTKEILAVCEDEIIKKYVTSLPEQLKANTENLFSYLYSELPWQSLSNTFLNKSAFHALSVALSQYFVGLEARIVNKENEFFKNIINYWNINQSELITFNYDTLIEKYLTKVCRWEYTSADLQLISTYLQSKVKSLFHRSIGLKFLRDEHSPLYIKYDSKSHFLEFGLPYNTNEKIPNDDKIQLKEKLKNLLPDDEFKNDLVGVIDSNLGSLFHLNNTLHESDFYQCELIHLDSRTGGGLQGSVIPEPQTAKLYKLHGSINWYYTGAFDTASEPIYYSPVKSNDPNSKEATGLIPVIIPPLLQKNSYYQNSVLKSQWQKLSKVLNGLEESIEFYFVGYSFPTTDFLAWSLFSSNLPKNRKYKIYLVNYLVVQNQNFVGESKKIIDYYLATFLSHLKSSETIYSQLIANGFFQSEDIIFDISLSIIDSDKGFNWIKSKSTIQNLSDHLLKR